GGTAQPGTPTGLVYEKFDKGLVRYFKSKTGSGLKAHISDRPTANQGEFEARIIRANFAGMEWSVDFSLDPTKVGGAPMRVVVDKINRSITSDQDLILDGACRRYYSYVLAQAMSVPLSLLPFNTEWFKWEFQGPAKLTADAKYNSDVDALEIRIGIKARTKALAERGESLEDVRNLREKEAIDLFTRAQRVAKMFDLPLDVVLAR